MKDLNDEAQLVFRAISHPVRRAVLDVLRERAGLSLNDLRVGHGISRQSFSQHIDALVDADLVRYEYEGRERLHYLNAVPLYVVADTWLANFVNPQVRALLGLKQRVAEKADARSRKRA